MKKRIILLSICAILALATLQYGQTLGNEKKLVHVDYGIRWTQCAFAPDGVLWVVWVPGDSNPKSGGAIWVASYDGTTVSEPFNVTGTTNIKANRPHITTSPKGHVLASWGIVADNATYLRVRNPRTKTWGPIETVGVGYGGDEPCAQMDGEGNIHIFFADEKGGYVFARSKIDGVWGGVVKLNEQRGKQGALTLAPDGIAHAAWIENGGDGHYRNMYTQRTKTTSWYRREALPGIGGASTHPWITSGEDSVAVIAWEDNPDPTVERGTEVRIMKVGGDGTVWVVFPFYMQHFPRIVVDSNGNLHAIVQIGGGDTGTGFRYSNNIGGTWMAQHQTIAGSYPKIAGLAADPFGNVAACQSSWTAPIGSGTDIYVYSLQPIKKVPMPEANFTFTPTTGYPPLNVAFHAVPAYGPNNQEVEYEWTFSEGATATGRNTTRIYNTHGTYTITLTITDSLGRTDEVSQTLVVKKTDPKVPLNPSATIAMSSLWQNPEITYTLSWAVNPANVPAHIQNYAIYMKEGTGEYKRILTVSPATLSTSFKFTDLKVKRAFAISTLGYGGTESSMAEFQ